MPGSQACVASNAAVRSAAAQPDKEQVLTVLGAMPVAGQPHQGGGAEAPTGRQLLQRLQKEAASTAQLQVVGAAPAGHEGERALRRSPGMRQREEEVVGTAAAPAAIASVPGHEGERALQRSPGMRQREEQPAGTTAAVVGREGECALRHSPGMWQHEPEEQQGCGGEVKEQGGWPGALAPTQSDGSPTAASPCRDGGGSPCDDEGAT